MPFNIFNYITCSQKEIFGDFFPNSTIKLNISTFYFGNSLCRFIIRVNNSCSIDKALGPWDQRPVFKTNVSQFTSLRNVEPQVPREVLRNLTKYFASPTDQLKLDPSFEKTNSPEDKHEILEPYADPQNVKIFTDLQKFESVGVVVPCEEEHMYYAAMNSKACKLTAIGRHYWYLVKTRKI